MQLYLDESHLNIAHIVRAHREITAFSCFAAPRNNDEHLRFLHIACEHEPGNNDLFWIDSTVRIELHTCLSIVGIERVVVEAKSSIVWQAESFSVQVYDIIFYEITCLFKLTPRYPPCCSTMADHTCRNALSASRTCEKPTVISSDYNLERYLRRHCVDDIADLLHNSVKL